MKIELRERADKMRCLLNAREADGLYNRQHNKRWHLFPRRFAGR